MCVGTSASRPGVADVARALGFEDVAVVAGQYTLCNRLVPNRWTYPTGFACLAVRGKRRAAAPTPPTMRMFLGLSQPDMLANG